MVQLYAYFTRRKENCPFMDFEKVGSFSSVEGAVDDFKSGDISLNLQYSNIDNIMTAGSSESLLEAPSSACHCPCHSQPTWPLNLTYFLEL